LDGMWRYIVSGLVTSGFLIDRDSMIWAAWRGCDAQACRFSYLYDPSRGCMGL